MIGAGLIVLLALGLVMAARVLVSWIPTADDYVTGNRFRDPDTGVSFTLPDGYALEDLKIRRPLGRKAILFERPGMAGPPGCAVEFWSDPAGTWLAERERHVRKIGGTAHAFSRGGRPFLGTLAPSLLRGYDEQSIHFTISGAQGYTLTCMNEPKDRAAFKADLEAMLASLSLP